MDLDLPTFLACPQCTFNRFMPSWYFFVFARLLVVFLVCHRRLDVVRVMGIAAILEFPYFYAWGTRVDMMYFDGPYSTVETIAGIGAIMFEAGVLHAAILYGISRVGYFALPTAPKFLLRRALIMIPVFIALYLLQNQFAYSSFSSSRP